MIDAWNRYWFRDVRSVDLARCRVVLLTFQVIWLVWSDVDVRIARHAVASDPDASPLAVLRLAALPLGGPQAIDLSTIMALRWVAIGAGALAVLGVLTRVSLGIFAWTQCLLFGWLYTGETMHHPEAILTITLVALAFVPSGSAWSVDARWRGGGRAVCVGAAWPLLLVRWLLALAYLSAASSKWLTSGLEWANGSTLQYFTFIKGMALDREFGIWLSEHHVLARALSLLTLAFESTFWLVLWSPRLALLFVPIGAALHTGIYVSVGAPFFQFVALYVVFWAAIRSRSSSRDVAG